MGLSLELYSVAYITEGKSRTETYDYRVVKWAMRKQSINF